MCRVMSKKIYDFGGRVSLLPAAPYVEHPYTLTKQTPCHLLTELVTGVVGTSIAFRDRLDTQAQQNRPSKASQIRKRGIARERASPCPRAGRLGRRTLNHQ